MRRRVATRSAAAADRRNGSFLVVALVCLVVAGALIATLLKLVESHRRQLVHEQHQSQAEWLAESALDRAAARLHADPAYAGETWSLDPAEMGGADGARVTIRIQQLPDRKDRRAVHAEAVFPADWKTVRRTRQTTIAVTTDS